MHAANRNNPSLPTALLAGFGTMRGKPVVFSVSWNDNCRPFLQKTKQVDGCYASFIINGHVEKIEISKPPIGRTHSWRFSIFYFEVLKYKVSHRGLYLFPYDASFGVCTLTLPVLRWPANQHFTTSKITSQKYVSKNIGAALKGPTEGVRYIACLLGWFLYDPIPSFRFSFLDLKNRSIPFDIRLRTIRRVKIWFANTGGCAILRVRVACHIIPGISGTVLLCTYVRIPGTPAVQECYVPGTIVFPVFFFAPQQSRHQKICTSKYLSTYTFVWWIRTHWVYWCRWVQKTVKCEDNNR